MTFRSPKGKLDYRNATPLHPGSQGSGVALTFTNEPPYLQIDVDDTIARLSQTQIENECINGTFEDTCWQRGTTLTTSLSSYSVIADRWKFVVNNGAVGTAILSKTTASVDGITRNAINWNQTVAVPSPLTMRQVFSGSKFKGKTLFISAYFEHVSGDSDVKIELIDGTSTASSVTTTGSGVYTFTHTCANNYANDALHIKISNSSTNLFEFKIAEVKVYVSEVELPVRRRTPEEELQLCLPYCRLIARFANDNIAQGIGIATIISNIGYMVLAFDKMIKIPSLHHNVDADSWVADGKALLSGSLFSLNSAGKESVRIQFALVGTNFSSTTVSTRLSSACMYLDAEI